MSRQRISACLALSFLKGAYRFRNAITAVKSIFFYRALFGSFGIHSRLTRPLKLRGTENIFVGDNVTFHDFIWLYTYNYTGDPLPVLKIGDGCVFGHFNHVTCTNVVEIGQKVLCADRVHISDNMHSFENVSRPILEQRVVSKGPVHIGDGSWLGENVSVLSCRIGRHCVIGANSVVTRDIPDYSVAVGAPARVIKRLNPETQRWERTAERVSENGGSCGS